MKNLCQDNRCPDRDSNRISPKHMISNHYTVTLCRNLKETDLALVRSQLVTRVKRNLEIASYFESSNNYSQSVFQCCLHLHLIWGASHYT